MKYKVIADQSIDYFEKKVSDESEDGWLCQGGVYIQLDANGTAIKYFQAMTLTEQA